MQRLVFAAASMLLTSAAAPRHETVTPAFNQAIPNIPGKSVVAAVVDYPPGGASPAHRHPKSAFIFAYVLTGEIKSSVDGSKTRIYRRGESWSEPPGAHHTISANASSTKRARLLAVFVVDTGERQLVTPDHP